MLCGATLPLFLFVIGLIFLDGFSLVKKNLLGYCILYGIGTALLTFVLIEVLLLKTTFSFQTIHLSLLPVLEELLKVALIFILARNRKIVFFIDAAIYGAAVAAGFALAENVLHFFIEPEMLFGTALFTGLATSTLHIGCTGVLATHLVMTMRERQKKSRSHLIRKYATAPLPSIFIHYVFVWLLAAFVPAFIALILTIACFSIIFVNMFRKDKQNIHAWIDESLNNDLELLRAIRNGQFSTTNAGQYMLSLKENFDPETVFDMCCYVSLYYELLLMAKGNMLIRGEGMEAIIDPATKAENRNKITELKALRRNIGYTGELALAPIVNIRDVDRWVLEALV